MTPQQKAFEIFGKYCYINRKWNDKGITIDFEAAKNNACEAIEFHISELIKSPLIDSAKYWNDVHEILISL